jgi:hypothetical protein
MLAEDFSFFIVHPAPAGNEVSTTGEVAGGSVRQ